METKDGRTFLLAYNVAPDDDYNLQVTKGDLFTQKYEMDNQQLWDLMVKEEIGLPHETLRQIAIEMGDGYKCELQARRAMRNNGHRYEGPETVIVCTVPMNKKARIQVLAHLAMAGAVTCGWTIAQRGDDLPEMPEAERKEEHQKADLQEERVAADPGEEAGQAGSSRDEEETKQLNMVGTFYPAHPLEYMKKDPQLQERKKAQAEEWTKLGFYADEVKSPERQVRKRTQEEEEKGDRTWNNDIPQESRGDEGRVWGRCMVSKCREKAWRRSDGNYRCGTHCEEESTWEAAWKSTWRKH